MAGLTGTAGKTFLSGRALLVMAGWVALAGWAVFAAHASRLAWDGSGYNLVEATALVAELKPDAEVVLVEPSPLTRLLVPLGRHTGRLAVSTVDAARLAALPPGPLSQLRAGDVQVRSGDAWVMLREPDLGTVLAALAASSGPDVRPAGPAPLDVVPGGALPGPGRPAGTAEARARALLWALTGLLVPAGVAAAGLSWRVRRRGR
jgi:hypothetical protein